MRRNHFSMPYIQSRTHCRKWYGMWGKQLCFPQIKTHWGRVTRICQLTNQHWFRKWLVAWSAPSHYLNQCWDIVNWKLGTNFSELLIEIHTFSFKKMHLKMMSILSRPQCVNDASFGFILTFDVETCGRFTIQVSDGMISPPGPWSAQWVSYTYKTYYHDIESEPTLGHAWRYNLLSPWWHNSKVSLPRQFSSWAQTCNYEFTDDILESSHRRGPYSLQSCSGISWANSNPKFTQSSMILIQENAFENVVCNDSHFVET